MTASRQEKRECEGIPRVKSPLKVAGACGRYDHTCDTTAHRDLSPKHVSDFEGLTTSSSHPVQGQV